MEDEREKLIRQRALDIWQREGLREGSSLGHWLQAEREIDEEADESVVEDQTEVVGLAAAATPTRQILIHNVLDRIPKVGRICGEEKARYRISQR